MVIPVAQNSGDGVVKRLNLSSFSRKKKNMKDPEIVVDWDSYRGYSSVLSLPLFEAAALDAQVGHTRPGLLEMATVKTHPNALAGTPTNTPNEATISMRWDEQNSQVILDMQLVLLAKRLQIPRETAAHIPITLEDVDGTGRKILFHFDKINYQPISPRPAKQGTK